jgi:hypothetical protein
MSTARADAPRQHGDTDADAEESEGIGSSNSSNAGSGVGSRLGAITPRVMEGFRSIVKKLGKSTADDKIDRPADDALDSANNNNGEDGEETLSYSGSDSGSDSSESEEVKQRRHTRKKVLDKRRSKSERSLHRSRSLSPTRRTRDLVGDHPALSPRVQRSGSTHQRDAPAAASSGRLSAGQGRKGGSERHLRTDRSGNSWKRKATKEEGSLTSGASSPLTRSPGGKRAAASSSSSAKTSPVASPRDAVQRDGLRNSGSSDLSSSNERLERRGRTMARRAGDTWGNFIARLSPRTTPRPLQSAASSPNLTTASASSGQRSVAGQQQQEESKASSSSKSVRKKKPTRTRSEDRINWGKDRIHTPSTSSSSSSSSSSKALSSPAVGSAGPRSRSLSPVRRANTVDRKGKHKKRNH